MNPCPFTVLWTVAVLYSYVYVAGLLILYRPVCFLILSSFEEKKIQLFIQGTKFSPLFSPVKNHTPTRMHSSRMRTVLCSGRRGGGVCPGAGGICVCPGGVCLGVSGRHPLPWTESQTGVKTLPSRNYIVDGNNFSQCIRLNGLRTDLHRDSILQYK